MAKHTTKEWFDMYREIVLEQVNDMLKKHASGERKLPFDPDSDDIKAGRADFNRALSSVEATFIAQGLSISDRIDLEGPDIVADEFGIPTAQWMPRVEPWVRFFWPDGSKIIFSGEEAKVACLFFQWWVGFQDVALREKIQSKKSRIIQPGTAEYIAYMNAKKADLN